MTIGQRIQQLRKEKGLSQEALGEALGVSRQAVSKWESDLTLPEIENLVAMGRLFHVPVGVLLGEEERPDSPGETERERTPDRPAAGAPRRRRWPWILAGAAATAVAVIAIGVFTALNLTRPAGPEGMRFGGQNLRSNESGAPLWLEAESDSFLELEQDAGTCSVAWKLEGQFCTREAAQESYAPVSAALRVYQNGGLLEETPLELREGRFSLDYTADFPVSAGDELSFRVEVVSQSGKAGSGEVISITFHDQTDGSLSFLSFCATYVEFRWTDL